MHLNRKWKVLFCGIALLVQATLLIKCPLFILRQISSQVFLEQACPEINTSSSVGQEYVFTMTVYSLLFIGRWTEALIIHIHIYKFFFCQSTLPLLEFVQLCVQKLAKSRCLSALFIILTLYMFLHCLSVPVLGIVLEIKNGRESNCEGYIYEYHTVYWILDVVRYLHDVVIRLMMLLATMVIGTIWSEESETETEAEASNKEPGTQGPGAGTQGPGAGTQGPGAGTQGPGAGTQGPGAGTQGSGTGTGTQKSGTHEPRNYMEYLADRDIACKDHKLRSQTYISKGSMVERIQEIFETWFIIPWVLYFIGSSLNSDHILRSWSDESSGDSQYDLSEVSYMVYNFNQLFLLTFAFLCSKKMNTHHTNYFMQSRSEQLAKHTTASRMALASMNKIEKEEHFDFVPRIWGSSIKIEVDNPLYVVFLLISIFFTVIEALI